MIFEYYYSFIHSLWVFL